LAVSAAASAGAAHDEEPIAENASPAAGIDSKPSSVRWSECSQRGNRVAMATSSRFSAEASTLRCSRV
jgi:hypothetical protein